MGSRQHSLSHRFFGFSGFRISFPLQKERKMWHVWPQTCLNWNIFLRKRKDFTLNSLQCLQSSSKNCLESISSFDFPHKRCVNTIFHVDFYLWFIYDSERQHRRNLAPASSQEVFTSFSFSLSFAASTPQSILLFPPSTRAASFSFFSTLRLASPSLSGLVVLVMVKLKPALPALPALSHENTQVHMEERLHND